jgi:hypothetical protein
MFEPSTFNPGSRNRMGRSRRAGAMPGSGSLLAWSVLLVGFAALIALIAPGA